MKSNPDVLKTTKRYVGQITQSPIDLQFSIARALVQPNLYLDSIELDFIRELTGASLCSLARSDRSDARA